MNRTTIATFCEGNRIEGYYVITEAKIATSKSGSPYLALTVTDTSGRIQAVCWNYFGEISSKDTGKVVYLDADVSLFRGTKQLTVENIRLADGSDAGQYQIDALVPVAPIDVIASMNLVGNYIQSIKDCDYKRIASSLISGNREAFSIIPAGKSVHHSFRHGLLMHTLNVLDIAQMSSEKYCVNRDLLITGALLHDIGKIQEFVVGDTGLVIDYSADGQMLGHSTIGARQVSEISKVLGVPDEKSKLLQHLILSHHGAPSRGAVVAPICLEAELLAAADMMDSRAEIYSEQYSQMDEPGFSDFVHSLNRRVYKHAES